MPPIPPVTGLSTGRRPKPRREASTRHVRFAVTRQTVRRFRPQERPSRVIPIIGIHPGAAIPATIGTTAQQRAVPSAITARRMAMPLIRPAAGSSTSRRPPPRMENGIRSARFAGTRRPVRRFRPRERPSPNIPTNGIHPGAAIPATTGTTARRRTA